MGSVMKHNKIVVAALAVCAAFGANAAFDADYLRPVRPIGVDGQPAWNGRSIFFMYPPTFGFAHSDGAASYRFTPAALGLGGPQLRGAGREGRRHHERRRAQLLEAGAFRSWVVSCREAFAGGDGEADREVRDEPADRSGELPERQAGAEGNGEPQQPGVHRLSLEDGRGGRLRYGQTCRRRYRRGEGRRSPASRGHTRRILR